MSEFQEGFFPPKQEKDKVLVDDLIKLTKEKRQKFGIDKRKDGFLAQEPDAALQKNIQANTDPVLFWLNRLKAEKGEFFASLDKLVKSLNEIIPQEEEKHFVGVGDEVSYNVSGQVVRIGKGKGFMNEYFKEAINNPSCSLLHFSGANVWDNDPVHLSKDLFLPINYIIISEK
jgi:hypothetical protein